jgi:hypothetical protein
MDIYLAVIAAVASSVFTLDLVRDLARRRRPHVAAFAIGIGMFAAATWALAAGLYFGWSGPIYRTFFLFGAVLNIPFLALGSMYLVVGKRAGTVMAIALGGLSAISITLVTTVTFDRDLPASGLPTDIFPPPDVFGPRLLAMIGSISGASLLVLLAVTSVVRFWRSSRSIVVGNSLILAGTVVAAGGGSLLGLGETALFAVSLMVTSIFLWAGYRVTRNARASTRSRRRAPLIVLVGPSTESVERAHAELLMSTLEQRGYEVFCPARDIEQWGDVGYTPAEMMNQTFAQVEKAAAVLVDLSHGYGTVAAGYAAARRIPVVVATPEGHRIPRPLRGVADLEIYYTSNDMIANRLAKVVPLEA